MIKTDKIIEAIKRDPFQSGAQIAECVGTSKSLVSNTARKYGLLYGGKYKRHITREVTISPDNLAWLKAQCADDNVPALINSIITDARLEDSPIE